MENSIPGLGEAPTEKRAGKWDKALVRLCLDLRLKYREDPAHSWEANPNSLALLRERLEPTFAAMSLFVARVRERCPSWFEEAPGSTDFAEALDELTKELSKWKT